MKNTVATFWRRCISRADRADPVRLVVLGYLSYTLLGWAALCLPWSRQDTTASALDHLFTTVSAMSTTGLATVSITDSYSFTGELIVLLLIQAGGLGYMTLGSYLLLAVSGRLSPLRARVGQTALALPDGFNVGAFVRLIVTYTVAVELAGAIALYFAVFLPHHSPTPIWQAVFHSVSAFCTAGFGLFNDSFESFRGDVPLNLIIAILSLLGAIGFLVVHDAWHSFTRRGVHVTLTTKIILVSTTAIVGLGTVLFFLDEPAVRSLAWPERWMASFFQVMSASTTVGFDTVPIGSLSTSSLFLLTIIMLIGASPAGTGGGIKTTTFTAVWAVMVGVLRRRDRTTFAGREIPAIRVRTAVASLLFYGVTLAAGIYALTLVESSSFADQLFECASALGTVGLSRGITGSLTSGGKVIVIALMFVGRIGPAVLGMSFFTPTATITPPVPEEDLVV